MLEGEGIARLDRFHQDEPSAPFHHQRAADVLWFLIPGSLDRFFAEIGRLRQPGEPELDSFPRPGNVAGIAARAVFGWTDDSFARIARAEGRD